MLSFIAGVENFLYFLLDVVFLDRCNFSTVSQAILASLYSNNLDLNDAWARGQWSQIMLHTV
jgi:hypothetical protein